MKLELDPRTGSAFRSKPQPGEFSDAAPLTMDDFLLQADEFKATIVQKVSADAAALGMTFAEVGSMDASLGENEWLVALAYTSPGYGYDDHWWRMNDDGTWSHKPGSTPIRHVDASGNTIYDPQTCDRGDYENFLGYFVVDIE